MFYFSILGTVQETILIRKHCSKYHGFAIKA